MEEWPTAAGLCYDMPAMPPIDPADVRSDDEARVVGGGATDMPFTDRAIERLDPRLSASALTLLQLAWRDRSRLRD